MNKIVERYIEMLFCRGCTPIQGHDSTCENHLLWMLCEIRDGNLSSITKCHRWLGYIQGVLVCNGILFVENERDLTREILNGE